jgi:hypothetical protein
MITDPDSDSDSPRPKPQSVAWIEEEISAEKDKSSQLCLQQESLNLRLTQGTETINKLKDIRTRARLLEGQNSELKVEIDQLAKESRVLKLKLNESAKVQQAIAAIDKELVTLSGQRLEAMTLQDSEALLTRTIETAAKIQGAVKLKVEALMTQHLCIVCTEQQREMLLLPCLHFALCTSCGEKVSRCPLCRTLVVERRSALSAI